MHVFPRSSGMKGSAPACMKTSKASRWPPIAASSTGVSPAFVRSLTTAAAAPFVARSSIFTTAFAPLCAARCSGVLPSSPTTPTLAPSFSSNLTTRSCLRIAAR